jgi:hypothetical protein
MPTHSPLNDALALEFRLFDRALHVAKPGALESQRLEPNPTASGHPTQCQFTNAAMFPIWKTSRSTLITPSTHDRDSSRTRTTGT